MERQGKGETEKERERQKDDTLLGSSKGCALYLCVSRWREEEGSLTTVGSLNPAHLSLPISLCSSIDFVSPFHALPSSSCAHAHQAGNWPRADPGTLNTAIYILHAKIRFTGRDQSSHPILTVYPRHAHMLLSRSRLVTYTYIRKYWNPIKIYKLNLSFENNFIIIVGYINIKIICKICKKYIKICKILSKSVAIIYKIMKYSRLQGNHKNI